MFRAANTIEFIVFNPAFNPVLVGTVRFNSLKGPVLEVGVVEINTDGPTRIVERVDGDTELMFPIIVALRFVPFLKLG